MKTRVNPSFPLIMKTCLLSALSVNTKSMNAKPAECAESIRPLKRDNSVLKRDWLLGLRERNLTQSRLQLQSKLKRASRRQIKLRRVRFKQISNGTLMKKRDRRSEMSRATKNTYLNADAFVKKKSRMT